MMGSFRRPRPRFMSSPVLSDLARFHASSPALQISNTSVWNSVQSAVIKVFQGGALQTNELFTLNESIRWLLKTEMGSFITDYFQLQRRAVKCLLILFINRPGLRERAVDQQMVMRMTGFLFLFRDDSRGSPPVRPVFM